MGRSWPFLSDFVKGVWHSPSYVKYSMFGMQKREKGIHAE